MGLIDLDNVKLGNGEDFPPTENFLKLKFTQGQINWLAQALTELNEAAESGGNGGSNAEISAILPLQIEEVENEDGEIIKQISLQYTNSFMLTENGLSITPNSAFSVDSDGNITQKLATKSTAGAVVLGEYMRNRQGTASVDRQALNIPEKGFTKIAANTGLYSNLSIVNTSIPIYKPNETDTPRIETSCIRLSNHSSNNFTIAKATTVFTTDTVVIGELNVIVINPKGAIQSVNYISMGKGGTEVKLSNDLEIPSNGEMWLLAIG